MKFIKYLFVLLLFYYESNAQNKLTYYSEVDGAISLKVDLDDIEFNIIKGDNGLNRVSFNGYYDLSNPGSFALPERTILIALPNVTTVSLTYTIEKTIDIEAIPTINPDIMQVNDSIISYDYSVSLTESTSYNKDEVIEIGGYTWVRDYYCVILKIKSNVVGLYKTQIVDEINLKLKLKSYGTSFTSKTQEVDEFDKNLTKSIINFDAAIKHDKKSYVQSDTCASWINYNKTYLKLGVNEFGVYRIYDSDLHLFNISTASIIPNTIKLFSNGKEYPIYVKGEDDGNWDPGDYIEFFGMKNMGSSDYRETSSTGEEYKEYWNRYSDTTVYFLTWGGDNGLRVTEESVIPYSADTLNYYTEIAHYEKDVWLDYSIPSLTERQLPGWKTNQTWIWGQQYVGSANRPFEVSEVVPNSIVRAFYKVQSFASNVSNNAHRIGLSINNYPDVYDSLAFDKYEQKVLKAEFTSNRLKSGANTLKTISYPTSALVNSIEYDWYEIEYKRFLIAKDNSLSFLFTDLNINKDYFVEVDKVRNKEIIFYKYYPGLSRLNKFGITNEKLFFNDSVKNGDKYYFTEPSGIKKPHYYYKKQFDDLASHNKQGDYIIITHEKFYEKSVEYASYIHQNYNVTTTVINVNDIYDQYNYGNVAPEPIKVFLHDAFLNWQSPKPVYLFIIGDANYDYKGNKTKYAGAPEVKNYVPSFGEPVSDSWYSIWDNDKYPIPQMFTGRLPISTLSEFDHYFNKHKNYNDQGYTSWNKRTLHFSGGNENNISELAQLKSINDEIIGSYIEPPPIGGKANHLYKTNSPPSTFGPYTNEEIKTFIDDGGIIISYLGHSGTQIWDNGINDVSQLHSTDRKSSLISDFGCSTGKFAEPDIKSFGELFVADDDGDAIAYIGNSSLGFVSSSVTFPLIFYKDIFRNGNHQIGNAHISSKLKLINQYGASITNEVFCLTNTLFGDPIISVKLPHKPNLLVKNLVVISNNEEITDDEDSVKVKFFIYNYGLSDTVKYLIKCSHYFNNSLLEQRIFERLTPIYKDSLEFFVKTAGWSGNHTIKIELDSGFIIDEIDETDNSFQYSFRVTSSLVRTLTINDFENKSDGKIIALNPSSYSSSEAIFSEISESPLFVNPRTFTSMLDTIITSLSLNELEQGRRYWLHNKLASLSKEFSKTLSFIYSPNNKTSYYINDSLSFSILDKFNCKFSDGIVLESTTKKIEVISAGFYDGGYALISVDGINYLPEGHLDGPHVAIFDASTYNYIETKRFSYWDNTAGFAKEFINYLNSLTDEVIVVIANSGGGGAGFTSELKNVLHEFGSTLVDQIGFRYSWALIGRKGAAKGSVPEVLSKPYEGAVKLDQQITASSTQGFFQTNLIGPVGRWGSIEAEFLTPDSAKINFIPIVYNNMGDSDTIKIDELISGQSNLLQIDAKQYPYLKFRIDLMKNNSSSSPILKNFNLTYTLPPELAINYQVVSVAQDTITQGQSNKLRFWVYNVGESVADSFDVKVELRKPDNSIRLLEKYENVKIDSMGKRFFELKPNTTSEDGWGNMSFNITIDGDNKILELYEDNNFYSIPFYVKKDTTTSVNEASLLVTYNGIEINDRDYISPQPDINIELHYPGWFSVEDTTAVNFSLNGQRISQTRFTKETDQVNNIIKFNYKPVLKDGEYVLRIFGSDKYGQAQTIPAYEKAFLVSNEIKIIDAYNYPNPFSDNTSFTFRLTKVPDDLQIKVYTVAGRLIREFLIPGSNLKTNFNHIPWDGKDQDGDLIASGVYLYKIIAKSDDKSCSITQKLAVMH